LSVFLPALVVPAVGSVVLGGLPAAAATPATVIAVSDTPGSGPLTSALAARLSQDVDEPVIVLLKSQAGLGRARAVQASLADELREVNATGIKRFTLVNSIAATVSALEAQRLAADPAVARVIPDVRFTMRRPFPAAPALAGTGAGAGAGAGARATAPTGKVRSAALSPHRIPGACAPPNKSMLAPEGLALTSTASDSATAPTARSLGFTGNGVKVAFIADGLDPGNVNLLRKNRTRVVIDYRDFTGNGPGVPTGGGEAFLDANTIAGQGVVVYNLNGFTAQGYPGTCDIQIQGVAPGASLVGLNVFSADPGRQLVTTTSTIAQAINYAVETDKVNVINESFSGEPLPDTTQDVVKLFDDAAVKAGVTVSASTGDAGTANTIGSPATDPNVISVGATTQFQSLAQANIDGTRYFATKGWLSDNISSFSSAGVDEAGGTVDLVAPGDQSWASCDANVNTYSDCVNVLGNPSDIEAAGGTSESAPFVAGAAALVIQAFRKGHHGSNPTPSQIKQILLSTATDLGAPAQEQGSGLLDSYKAVQLAESYGSPRRTGTTLLVTPGQLTSAGVPGTARSWKVTVTNEGTSPQVVMIAGRALSPRSTSSARGSVTLSDSSSGQYTADSGVPVNYATFTFRVPAGQGRLDVSVAYPARVDEVFLPPDLTLFDPDGRVAADSEPQGLGNYGNVDVRVPAAGVWTAVVSGYQAGYGGYNGKVIWQEMTQDYTTFGHYSASSLSLAPGRAQSFSVSVNAPSSPGDLAGSVQLHSSLGGVTSIPLVVRTLVDVSAGGGIAGVLTGGNGRNTLGAADYYQFNVPAHQIALRAELALRDNPGTGNSVGAYLISPDGNVLGYGQNYDMSEAQLGITNTTLTATTLHPVAGRWTLIVALAQPVAGTEVADPYTGAVAFTTAGTENPAGPLPDGGTLAPGKAVTIPLTITNTSNAPQDYYLDARTDQITTKTLAPLSYSANEPFQPGSAISALPLSAFAGQSLYFVPTETSSVTVRQTSTVPAMTDLASFLGDPDAGAAALSARSLCGRSESVSYTPSGGRVTSGGWLPGPAECGPFRSAARSGTATDTVSVTTAAFDPAVSVATGDLEQLAEGAAAGNTAIENVVELQPGRSATVNVTFRPAGRAGTVDSGTLYLDALQSGVPPNEQLSGDEVAALSYSYKVGNPDNLPQPCNPGTPRGGLHW
jgi:Subtilase family